MDTASRTVHRACNLCEALCGLDITVAGREIISIRGDEADTFSRGHICPKAVALKDIYDDPNRLRQPVRRVNDTWKTIGWDEAFDLAAEQLAATVKQHGNHAVGLYAGNPSVHNIGTLFSIPAVVRVLNTRNLFSATSVDQLPQQLASLLMFGHQFLIPIPDIDHTDYFLILGANPIASNGSMMSVPDVARRLKAIQARGGKVVVIDPRRTETAEVASEHHFIKPASDAALLMAIINTMREENLFRLTHPEKLSGLDDALASIADMTATAAEPLTGIDAATIRRLAREFAAAPSAICYGRVGTTLQAFGTLNQWLVQLVNIVSGNLDRVGGTLATEPLIPITGAGTRPGHYNQWQSRVRKLPESLGELPAAALAEEILTPGSGQIRALLTTCGNPVLATPNGRKLDRALASLGFMVSVDIYINETTRHANLILPPTSSLNHDHYDYVFNALAVRNVSRYNAAIWERPADERYDWEIFAALTSRLAAKLGREGRPPQAPAKAIAAMMARWPQRYGTSFETLLAATHGINHGALTPSLFTRLETPDQRIQCAPKVVMDDISRFLNIHAGAAKAAPDKAFQTFTLIGRRHVRSNNSWMHQSHRLIKGKPRDQLMMHPTDLAHIGAADGELVEVRSSVGVVEIAVQATDTLMPGVVSLPHGFGHNRTGTQLGLAHDHAGVSYNDLTDTAAVDAVSGNAAMNGIEVTISAIARRAAQA